VYGTLRCMGQEDEVTPIMIPAGEYITLEQAATLAGYSSGGNLRTAAVQGRLRTIVVTNRLRLTTREWLDAYLATVQEERRGWERGKKRGPRPRMPARSGSSLRPGVGATPEDARDDGGASVGSK
jgi:hypothetical protein